MRYFIRDTTKKNWDTLRVKKVQMRITSCDYTEPYTAQITSGGFFSRKENEESSYNNQIVPLFER